MYIGKWCIRFFMSTVEYLSNAHNQEWTTIIIQNTSTIESIVLEVSKRGYNQLLT